MYVGTGALAEEEEAADLGGAHGSAGAVSPVPPPGSQGEGTLEARETFLQRHWWLWPALVIVCGAVAGAIGLAQVTRLDGR